MLSTSQKESLTDLITMMAKRHYYEIALFFLTETIYQEFNGWPVDDFVSIMLQYGHAMPSRWKKLFVVVHTTTELESVLEEWYTKKLFLV